MLINSFILALSSSIDSLGIGITYGIKNTRISYIANVVLFVISFTVSIISIWIGNSIRAVFSDVALKWIGSSILIFMGLFMFFQALKKDSLPASELIYKKNEEKIYSFFIKFLGITIKIIKNPISSDFDNSRSIDSREALFLGLALSLDSFCIGTCGSIIGINSVIFPLLVSTFQLALLSFGIFVGTKLHETTRLPNNVWSIISSILLVFIGFMRILL